MIRDKAYLIGINPYSFRKGEPAEIVGVELLIPEGGLKKRLCYHVMWADKGEDWIPVADDENYKIISFEDILSGNIPKVV